ncbi:OmpA family protein [Burkholderia cepacia]|uniref:OmpA family protein n=1 Tax=Burkholderia cepacia TaxID=292 RepID=A0A2S8I9R9_BURCE|nr:OmpA family protein [Burkholderia cepacia]PQP11439.1 OmpA family protein [Burkholderia cepacia]HDR9511020.1 OmpA family protein [Burkholderia cepacia]
MAALMATAVLSGCAVSSGPTYSTYEVNLPNGEKAFRTTCYGLAEGVGTCQAKAQEICRDQPVRGVAQTPLTTDRGPREITFQCGALPVAARAPEVRPAPAPVRPAPPPPRALTLSGDANFETAKANLTANAREQLDQIIEQGRGTTFKRVVAKGYTDARGSEAYNQSLSERRAESVVSYLKTRGLTAMQFVAQGYGKANPVASNANEHGRAQNRRVEVTLD